MKRLVTIVVLMLGCITTGVAQDVIVTQESELIEADILEISETEVKYKKHSNPTGPTFVLSTAKISSIIYANGDVQAFNVKNEGQKREYEPYYHLYRGIELDLTAGANIYLSSLVNASAFMGTVGIGRRFNPNFYAGLSFSFIPETEAFPLMAVARGYIPLKNPKYEATAEVGLGYVIDGDFFVLTAIPGIQMPLTHWMDLRAGAGLMTAFTGYGTILMSSLNATLALHGTTDLNKKKEKRTTLNKGLQISIEGGFGDIVRGSIDRYHWIDADRYLSGEEGQPRIKEIKAYGDFSEIEVSPVISYKFNPHFSIGAGMGIGIGENNYRIKSDAKYTLTCHDEPEKTIMLDWKHEDDCEDYYGTRFFVRGEYRFSSKRFSPFASVELGFLTKKLRISQPPYPHASGDYYPDHETRFFTIDIVPAVGMSLRVGSNSYISLKCQYNLALPKTLDESYSYYDNYNGTYTNERGRYCDYTEEYSYVNRTVYFSKWYIKLGFTQTLNILSDKKPVDTGKNSERVLD